jgi:hypothetical protein
MLPYEYARSALKLGLELEGEIGVNPFKFGLVGSTDGHTGLTSVEEESFFGPHVPVDTRTHRDQHCILRYLLYARCQPGQESPAVPQPAQWGWDLVAGGLAAVWATGNTREALFDAMERKETYATTGPRILVRFFGGWDFQPGPPPRAKPPPSWFGLCATPRGPTSTASRL